MPNMASSVFVCFPLACVKSVVVLLVPHPPQYPTSPHQPHVFGGGGLGHVGLRWGGGGVLGEYHVYFDIYTHTCWCQDYGGKKYEILKFHFRFTHFQ
jgi:hypothetical protein